MTPTTLSPSKPQRASSADWPAAALPEHWIDSLFERLEGFYGAKFANAWAGTSRAAMRRLWAIELATLGRDELAFGVKALRTLAWPPTLPEFIALCRPPVNYDAALYEATQQLRLRGEGKDQWTNPAFYWAAVKVGEFDMLNLSHSALIKRYSAALDEVLRGEVNPVPPRAVALPATGKTRAQPERVQAAVAEVKAMRKDVGNKDWAKRILERQKRGEKFTLAVVDMAKRALGMPIGVAA
ncbi:hypothetical protein [Cupriavidus gilardii]|uniref:hypothetical protein n=1 Tax=Cupriavidus gilardii TaxID=82541 RepID=UPI001574AE92|nr:hypothetical protein [Cupriavidus gilardii]NSX05065.1 hypothetical protein [Cupriavidus gilardii]